MSQMSGAQAMAAIVDDLAQPETCTCGTTEPDARAMEGHLREVHGMDGNAYPDPRTAEEHEVVPAEGDFFALATICQHPSCGRRAWHRLGTLTWEHADPSQEA